MKIYSDVSNFSFALMVGLLVEDMNANLLIDKNPTYIRTILKLNRNVVLVVVAAFPNSVTYVVHDDKK